MPCFKGIAVSVHADGAPLSEHSIQKHSKTGRITTYIPVPQPKVSAKGSGKPEKSKFAISITLLTPGLPIPYSTPKTSPDGSGTPQPQYVADLDEDGAVRHGGGIGPYQPVTISANETIAAYIYFDGRGKEEVATLLRPGEETWVNSRWVQDGSGGLAEREFLFREVGLERWLNGLDLEKEEGQAAKLERRREKLQKRRERQLEKFQTGVKSGVPTMTPKKWTSSGQGLLVYGSDLKSPVEEFSDEGEDSDDDPPESTGQIKVAMFRVLASGEIKKGEYSPQFDANDDGDAMDAGNDDEADHTTSFAKPKALDPKSISTQTVTGLDGPESPYAVFTFLYRGERQLRKMGVLPSAKGKEVAMLPGKRPSRQMDFSNLPPLKSTGTVGFTNFRDVEQAGPRKLRKKSNGSNKLASGDDSDDDEDEGVKVEDADEVDMIEANTLLSPEESKFRGELADGLKRIKLKRQRSAGPEEASPSLGSPTATSSPSPPYNGQSHAPPHFNSSLFGTSLESPLKKHRASVLGSSADNTTSNNTNNSASGLPAADILGAAEAGRLEPKVFSANNNHHHPMDDDDDDIEL